MIQRIGEAAYKLNLSGGRNRQALCGIDDIVDVNVLRPHGKNGLGMDIPPIEVDGEVEFEVEKILKQRQLIGEDQYLVRWKGFDQSEDMWLNETQLDHSSLLLENFKRP